MMHDSEVERWKLRASSLEARMRAASDARRQWALREAELLEKNERQARQLQAQERMQVNLDYLRNTLIKGAEGGPRGLADVLPLVAAFLEFSPEEKLRLKQAQQAQPSAENLWGLLAGGSSNLDASSSTNNALAGESVVSGEAIKAEIKDEIKADANGKNDKAKLARMKKLLAAADKRLSQSQAALQAREADIAMLRARLEASHGRSAG
eukprot:22429-Pleurochrysis_carterae.AAC.4